MEPVSPEYLNLTIQHVLDGRKIAVDEDTPNVRLRIKAEDVFFEPKRPGSLPSNLTSGKCQVGNTKEGGESGD